MCSRARDGSQRRKACKYPSRPLRSCPAHGFWPGGATGGDAGDHGGDVKNRRAHKIQDRHQVADLAGVLVTADRIVALDQGPGGAVIDKDDEEKNITLPAIKQDELNWEIEKTKKAQKINEEMSKLTKEELEKLHDIVNERTRYGIREEVSWDKPHYRLVWSNSSRSWHVSKDIPKDVRINLDANEIIVPADSEEKAEAITKLLPALPLYELSTEAGVRGESPNDTKAIWVMKQIEKIQREKSQREGK